MLMIIIVTMIASHGMMQNSVDDNGNGSNCSIQIFLQYYWLLQQ